MRELGLPAMKPRDTDGVGVRAVPGVGDQSLHAALLATQNATPHHARCCVRMALPAILL